ncbi:MAG: PKD domain-containing protein, partial [Solirubrobacterales bacterium]|nr:PKD domain-containing protein [Solirubrobacterales bacterium]
MYPATGAKATAPTAPTALRLREPRGIAVVPNREPVADFDFGPNPAAPGETVTFDASAASDPDGPLARYDWDLDGDGAFETSTGQTPTVARAYGAEAEISVGLRVTDAQGSSDERGDVLVVGDFAQEEQRLAAEEEEEAAAGARGGAPILSGLRVRPRRLRAARRGGS